MSSTVPCPGIIGLLTVLMWRATHQLPLRGKTSDSYLLMQQHVISCWQKMPVYVHLSQCSQRQSASLSLQNYITCVWNCCPWASLLFCKDVFERKNKKATASLQPLAIILITQYLMAYAKYTSCYIITIAAFKQFSIYIYKNIYTFNQISCFF